MQSMTIDLERLDQALNAPDALHFLDLDSGRILAVAPGQALPGTDDKYDIQPDRYLHIEPLGLSEAIAMREAFLLTQHNPHAHAVLTTALGSRRPLRTFDYELEAFPDIREAWRRYQATQLREHAYAWLLDQGIEPSRR
ncbi:UPF0158 family protein [Stutzerimonas tarimensis]|uniref:UPF0158 family protein n=1 Tax=Stutzerimonas tarimensis TaxID=1507735 RepID=A0ABV7T4F2_9GAMM